MFKLPLLKCLSYMISFAPYRHVDFQHDNDVTTNMLGSSSTLNSKYLTFNGIGKIKVAYMGFCLWVVFFSF